MRGEDPQQRRLAGPVGPDDPQRLAALDLQIYAAQRPQVAPVVSPGSHGPRQRLAQRVVACGADAQSKALSQVLDLDRRLAHLDRVCEDALRRAKPRGAGDEEQEQ